MREVLDKESEMVGLRAPHPFLPPSLLPPLPQAQGCHRRGDGGHPSDCRGDQSGLWPAHLLHGGVVTTLCVLPPSLPPSLPPRHACRFEAAKMTHCSYLPPSLPPFLPPSLPPSFPICPVQLLFMMDSNSKAYDTALTEGPDKAEQKLLLIIHRAMPCFDFLKVRGREGGREGGRMTAATPLRWI